MNEFYPDDSDLLALVEDDQTGVSYIETGKTPYYLEFRKMLYRLLANLQPLGLRPFKTGTLAMQVKPGHYWAGGTLHTFAGTSADVTLADNSTNLLWLLASDGAVHAGTSWPSGAAEHVKLASIVTSGGSYGLADLTDLRTIGDSHNQLTGGIASVSADTSPALGGDLTVAGHKITSASNGNIVIEPNGNGAIVGLSSGDARGIGAVDLQLHRTANSQVASGVYSVVVGGGANTASGDIAGCISGWGNVASGALSSCVGGTLNVAPDHGAICAGGESNHAGYNAGCLAGSGNLAAGYGGVCLGGYGNQISGAVSYAVALGGCYSVVAAGGESAVAMGEYARASLPSQFVQAAGQFAATGDAQFTRYVLRGSTTDDTPTVLSGPAPFTLDDGKTYALWIRIAVRNDAGGMAVAMCDTTALADRTGGTVTVALGTINNPQGCFIGSPSEWSFSIAANDTAKTVEITVVGEVDMNIRWVAVVEAVEVGFPPPS